MSFTQAIILKDSIDKHHNRLTTFRLRLPRIILAELNTHRINSKSTSSSRAIPVKSNIEQVQNNPFIPDQWTKNSRGMFSLEVIDEFTTIKDLWVEASKTMCYYSSELSNYELHKQYANRLLEPFMYVDTIFSGTDFDNFFHLRTAEDTQPEIRELANLMYDAYKESIPVLLKHGQWHLPYIDYKFIDQNTIEYSVNGQELDLDTAIKVSISCCGQVSYRKLDTTVEKALSIYNKFVSGPTIHSSALEHAATPFSDNEYNARMDAIRLVKFKLGDEVSNFDLDKFLYKRNLRGWTQYRTMVANDTFINKFEK